MINDTIRIRLSLGLIVVAIVHAILLVLSSLRSITSHRSRNPSRAGRYKLSTNFAKCWIDREVARAAVGELAGSGRDQATDPQLSTELHTTTRLSRASGSSAHNRATTVVTPL